MQLVSANACRPKASFVRADTLVTLWLESFEENDAKNIRSDVYQANASIIRAFLFVLLREKKEKNNLTPDTWDSLNWPHW